MKKILGLVANTGIILLMFALYALLQTLYTIPDNFKATEYWLEVVGIIILTVILVGFMWIIYRRQLKRNNPQNFNRAPHFKGQRLVVAILGMVAMLAIQYVFVMAFGNKLPDNQAELNQLTTTSKTLFKVLIAFIAPVIEEIIFRGYLVNTFFSANTWFSKISGVILGGLVFGLLHEPQFSPFLLIYWGMGMVLMVVYLVTKDLRYSMLVHIFNNSLSLF